MRDPKTHSLKCNVFIKTLLSGLGASVDKEAERVQESIGTEDTKEIRP